MLESTFVELSLGEARATAVLQAIADPVRWRVLSRLSSSKSCVCDLQSAIDIAPNLLSYHLKVLRSALPGELRG
jgi:ArsR family transcriptional regulator